MRTSRPHPLGVVLLFYSYRWYGLRLVRHLFDRGTASTRCRPKRTSASANVRLAIGQVRSGRMMQ